MVHLTGIIGFILFCAGLHQLWLARAEMLFWLRRFFELFTLSLQQRDAARQAPLEFAGHDRRGGAGALHVASGIGLLCCGSFLILLSLGLILLRKGLF
jgi:hypothetical protein